MDLCASKSHGTCMQMSVCSNEAQDWQVDVYTVSRPLVLDQNTHQCFYLVCSSLKNLSSLVHWDVANVGADTNETPLCSAIHSWYLTSKYRQYTPLGRASEAVRNYPNKHVPKAGSRQRGMLQAADHPVEALPVSKLFLDSLLDDGHSSQVETDRAASAESTRCRHSCYKIHNLQGRCHSTAGTSQKRSQSPT